MRHKDVDNIEDFEYETRHFIRNGCLDHFIKGLLRNKKTHWHHGAVVITRAQLHSTKPKFSSAQV